MTIYEFLGARFDEAETGAREVIELEDLVPGYEYEYQWARIVRRPGNLTVASSSFQPGAPTPHDVLRTVAAYRAILVHHRTPNDACDAHDDRYESIPCDTVRALASFWRRHPDYQKEWEA